MLSNRLAPVSRRELIKRLKEIGFVGPYIVPDHAFMVRGITRVKIPNPHKQELSTSFLKSLEKVGSVVRSGFRNED
jgi:predicted RNA binding protein YcfA (HicA-like mRNA interferase family)